MLEDLPLDRRLRLALEDLALTEPTEVQSAVVPLGLAGRDIKVTARTGSGKTLAYLIPLAQRLLDAEPPPNSATLALILVPTRELARQVLKQARQLIVKSPLKAMAVTGGADFKYQAAQFRKNPEIVIATPGRLLEHCEKRSADLAALQMLVLDEADRMLDMGFRDDVLKIYQFCAPTRQVVMLSATLKTRGLSELAQSLLQQPATVAIGEIRSPHRDIFHQVILADSREHKDKLLPALLQQGQPRRSLVFANKRSTASRLAGLLHHLGLKAACLHGEMSTEERKQVMVNFAEGKVNVVTASDLAARGLDVQDIELVVNYDLPHKGDDYLHRTGRTGRAGNKGLAVSLVDGSEWNLMVSIERYLKLDFERRTLPGLKARYNGPKKTKGSGKAAGSKKKTLPGSTKKARLRDQKNKGKPKPKRREAAASATNDGFAPPRKKPGRGLLDADAES